MPTYEYQCDACGHAFEQFQSIKASPIKKCPSCGKNKVKRLLGTGAGFVFKGSGFYITDYRSDSYNKAAKAAEGAASGNGEAKPAAEGSPAKADAKTETKSDAKPAAAKAEAKPESKPAAKPPAKSKGK